ncbi:MAG: magnesium transporter [Vicinamibacterales bacterium]
MEPAGEQVLTDAVSLMVLSEELQTLPPPEAASRLESESDDTAARALALLNPGAAVDILAQMPTDRCNAVIAAAPGGRGDHWRLSLDTPETQVGRFMEPPLAVYRPDTTVGEAIDSLRQLVQQAFITYIFVTDAQDRLVGVLAFRELLFARRDQRLDEIMLRNPFSLGRDMELVDAMKAVVTRHFPAYPVTDEAGRLEGMERGQTLFERQAYEISAQAGAMVGVEQEERVATHWLRSFKFRHPWLQLNLVTAFVAAAVVGFFEDTIESIVVLAVFLPVLAGQSGNTGCQALAVTLRGMTLGDLKSMSAVRLVLKEALLGVMNGLIVGLVAGGGMWWYAAQQGEANPFGLAAIVVLAMAGACAISGISGALIPLTLKRLGADPATASSIFLTTMTDVASMGMLLGLATIFFM